MSCAAEIVFSVAQPGSGLQVPMSDGLRVPHALLMAAVAFGTDLVPARMQFGSRAPNVLAVASRSFWHFVPPWTISLTMPASDLTILSTHLILFLLPAKLALPAVKS